MRTLPRFLANPAELVSLLSIEKTFPQNEIINDIVFPFRIPYSLLPRIKVGDEHDPILQQVLPLKAESKAVKGFTKDPVEDSAAVSLPRLLRKYQGRALLMVTDQCLVHCRFCFRRHNRLAGKTTGPEDFREALFAVKNDKTLSEIILSGGDPLCAEYQILHSIIAQLEKFDHIRRLRVHTRFPVVMPDHFSDSLISLFADSRFHSIFILHINHPNEIDCSVQHCVKRIIDAGIQVFSQSVLLKGVNDSVETLVSLFEKLVETRIVPYYLHQMDRVAGGAHFYVEEKAGKAMMIKAAALLPGYAMPKYVKEIPGNPCKTLIM